MGRVKKIGLSLMLFFISACNGGLPEGSAVPTQTNEPLSCIVKDGVTDCRGAM